ncbi:hypothetical protein BKA62DRAFT_662549 [Auriculariales sp. MPI-PUGE-AT-0066]|nr:hypothetical protein BKA62DRAFT_662549 [Auriculariales sp. MPI-PUGE-AT-0066]
MSNNSSQNPPPSPREASPNSNGRQQTARQSLAGVRGSPSPHSPIPSPRPSGIIGVGRPTSELLQGNAASAFQTPEESAIDAWFENLQNYEATLEEMAAASLDANFKEELTAIEQWFRVLSEAERTAALYSLLQHSTQVQIRFFVTVLQHMARADPMTALLSPAFGASMQDQMEKKLSSLGLKSPNPALASPRSFGNQQSQRASLDASAFLSASNVESVPSPTTGTSGDSIAAAKLAQQRAALKANRISAPVLLNANNGERSAGWGTSSLGQVIERGPSPSPSDGGSSAHNDGSTSPAPGARPKSTDFTGVAKAFKSRGFDVPLEDQLSPMIGGNWASMSNTPIVPIFGPKATNVQDAADKLNSWSQSNTTNGPVVIGDVPKFRRKSGTPGNDGDSSLGVPVAAAARSADPAGPTTTAAETNNNNNNNYGARSPALSNVSSGRFGGSDDGGQLASAQAQALAMGMGMGSPSMAGMNPLLAAQMSMNMGMGMGGFNPLLAGQMGMGGMGGMNPLAAAQFGSPEAMLAAQMGWNAAASQLGGMGARGGPGSMRAGPSSNAGGSSRGVPTGADKKDPTEEDVDPALLNDVAAWLRSLRLHKYTPNFEGCNWKDMVMMDEAALEARGVAALGARRKMLKTFEVVRAKMGV